MKSSNAPELTVSSITAEIQSLPKVDLHRHLEGSLRLDSMVDIVSAYDLDLPTSRDALKAMVQMGTDDPRNVEVFLAKFQIIRQFFRSEQVIQRLVEEVVEDAASDGLTLLELRFTPAALRQSSGLPLGQLLDTVIAVGRSAAAKHHLELGLIVSINRHEAFDLAEAVVQLEKLEGGY